MKSLNGQTEREPSPSVETYWVVDVFGQNDKVKRKSRRPPTLNPEDYTTFLRKVLSTTNANGGVGSAVDKLYGKDSQMSAEIRSKLSHSVTVTSASDRDGRPNNKLAPDVSDILKKLRLDLFFSFASFCKEFAGETCDGIALLMDLLRTIQMAQVELNGSNKELSNVRANRRSLIRNASTDELEVLLSLYQLCLANGHVPGKDHGLSRLMAHNAGFYGLALALVSNLTRTRSLALQLMTALCKMPGGHSRVSEALTTLRLNMGESVRLKLLSGIVNSTASRVESLIASNEDGLTGGGDVAYNTDTALRFLVEAMAFLNSFVQSAPDLRNQVVIQWEVEEAALNIHALAQVADSVRSPLAAQLRQELSAWSENQINIALLLDRLTNVTSTNEALRKDLLSLRSRLLALESEKKRFSEFENDMKKRCADLETELTTLRINTPVASFSSIGIQATDFRMEEKITSERSHYDWYNIGDCHMSCDDEDYDIDDVIEELNNIVNSAESDMNTEKNSSNCGSTSKDSGSFTEEHLVPKYLPRPPPRPESKKSLAVSPNAVHLDDLTGETSDFPLATVISATPESTRTSSDSDAEAGPTEISRKKITQNFFRQSKADNEDEGDDDKTFNSSVCESDWNKTQILRRNIRKSFGSVEGSNSRELSMEDMTEEKIKPDILRAIPTRLFHKSWDVLEARSPMYTDDMVIPSSANMNDGPHMPTTRRRHASVDNINALQRESPIFIHPMVHHPNLRDRATEEMMMFEQHQQQRFLMGHSPLSQHMFRHPDHFRDSTMSPVDPAAHLGDLQVGDVFSFPGQYSGHSGRGSSRTEHGSRKSKRNQDIDGCNTSKPGSRNSFAFASLIPGFIKSSFGSSRDSSSKSSREEWENFHTDKVLMKDYRQHFQPHQSILPSVLRHSSELDMSPAEFWPPSFQAMPFRNIPQPLSEADPRRSQRNRSIRVSSPAQIGRGIHSNASRIAKLMDHPSGMY
ncbi:uncharacterized protein LOC123471528 [Daphnia magna]|uniref:GBD/FH3 domain-containing protein n=1 Tax=Daphnia magna TaxID=35525 RepID=A0ABQ9ZAS6_9CRUS|nr:uncharacterized protein LOC123471528 [Daphnia magna]KAK4009744.1 hypothetical protein OUZ56_018890 [Daphnia magna]